MKHTKENWKIGKFTSVVITDSEEGLSEKTGHAGAEALKFYGGNLVCESIQRIKDAKLIAAAPDLLEALLDIIVQAERLPYGLPADLSDSIKILGKQAIKKATE